MKNVTVQGIIFFIAVMISMCVLKLWFTLFLIFGYAVLMTMKNRKKNFCSEECPLGIIQDYIYEKNKRAVVHKNKVIKSIFYILFTAYIIAYILILYNQPFALWRQMLYLMFFSMAAASILQEIFGKRYWCINMCPLGNVLDVEMKILRKKR